MPLPTPKLDDRQFQDIVDDAKRLIPQFCPEWTDHNVSDPGVALIELFAWMTDLLLYRVNQVPDKMHVKFLELLGVRLEPPSSAQAPVTMYLSAPQAHAVRIPAGTEVATVRTETAPAIIFTTEADLEVHPPRLAAILTRTGERQAVRWTTHDLSLLEQPEQSLPTFGAVPAVNDAFLLGFHNDVSQHVLALRVECVNAGGAGVQPQEPPLIWEAWQGGAAPWVPCVMEFDSTGGFNVDGEIVLRTPAMRETVLNGETGYWMRCRLTAAQDSDAGYIVTPRLTRLEVEARGGTVVARHATTVLNEELGWSDGTPNQRFALQYAPVLMRDAATDTLEVHLPTGEVQRWTEVKDFAESTRTDRHFTLDALTGEVTFGPLLPQPHGGVQQFGAIPTKGGVLRFTRYQHGGGVHGNVSLHALSTLKTSIPFVARVTNHVRAAGGVNAQDLEDAKTRVPLYMRTRTRAVTADDYEHLALQVEAVQRAHCLTPGVFPGQMGDQKPGNVVLVILPKLAEVRGYIPPDALAFSQEVRAAVTQKLTPAKVLGTTLTVRPPLYFWVSVHAKVRCLPNTHPTQEQAVLQRAREALFSYLNPYTGGPDGAGWPFGRDVHRAELMGVLHRVPGVDFIEELRFSRVDPSQSAPPEWIDNALVVPPYGLVCSAQHTVTLG